MDIMLYLLAGLSTLVFGYYVKIILPLLFGLAWQLARPITKPLCGSLTIKKGNIFYIPKDDDPLTFHWYIPNHAKSIPALFFSGIILCHLHLFFIGLGEEDFFKGLYYIVLSLTIYILIGYNLYLSLSKKETRSELLERFLFLVFGIISLPMYFELTKELVERWG